jgi:hypothetical protein
MSQNPAEKKLDVDDAWKQQAQQEKQQLGGAEASTKAAAAAPNQAQKPAAKAPAGRPAAARMPEASFDLIVEQYVTQTLFALGAIAHPVTGKRERNLDLAKHYIDMLAVLETKSKGNLTAEEQQVLDSSLYEMRMQYVNAARTRG